MTKHGVIIACLQQACTLQAAVEEPVFVLEQEVQVKHHLGSLIF